MPRWKVGCGVDAEEMLALFDEVCSLTGAHVVSYPAAVALSALISPHIAGIPVFGSPAAHATYLSQACTALAPLSSGNDVLGHVLGALVTESL